MFNYKYLSQNHLKGFKHYKYSAIDTSPLSKHVMHPFWNAAVKLLPKWIAPNLITFVGFLSLVTAVFLLYLFDYDLTAAVGKPDQAVYGIPNWVYGLCGVLIFISYNLDGIDGKQARRTGVSGPLGELFDHGLDSYVVFLMPYCTLSLVGRDPEYSISCFRGYLLIVSIVMNFYVSHCEKYNTGTLYLPWAYDFSMWVTSLLFITAGVYGPGVFKTHIMGVNVTQVFEITVHSVGTLTTLPVAIYNVYLSYQTRSGKMYSIPEAIRPMWSLLLVTTLMTYWAVKSTDSVIEYDPRAFIFLFGTLFSQIASRLIIAEMSHTRCELVTWMLWPALAGAVLALRHPGWQPAVLYTLLVTLFAAHLHYGICVVRQICQYFNINCFKVPKKPLK